MLVGTNTWTDGPTLPSPMYGGAALATEDGNSLLYVGGGLGQPGYPAQNFVWKLDFNIVTGFQWSIYTSLSVPRILPVAMLVPDTATECFGP